MSSKPWFASYTGNGGGDGAFENVIVNDNEIENENENDNVARVDQDNRIRNTIEIQGVGNANVDFNIDFE